MPTKREVMQDIIIDMICQIEQRLHPSADILLELEKDLRSTWGGDRPYIPHRRGDGDNRLHSERNSRILRAYQQGKHIAWLAKKESLSERRVLQIVSTLRAGLRPSGMG